MIRNSGEEPEVIEYLKTPTSTAKIRAILTALNIGARDLLRQRGTPYDELGLGDPKWSDAELIELMHLHPVLINRPVVLSALGARLCRPAETVLEILPSA